jgi:hypothetical protein
MRFLVWVEKTLPDQGIGQGWKARPLSVASTGIANVLCLQGMGAS